MARKKSASTEQVDASVEPSSEIQEVQETIEDAQTAVLEENEPTLKEEVPAPSSKEPLEVELRTAQKEEAPAPAQRKEEIEAAIQEKLSRKTDSEGADPFVPNIQLENEVKDIASKKGFPLSRGTEIGARLMARSKRTLK